MLVSCLGWFGLKILQNNNTELVLLKLRTLVQTHTANNRTYTGQDHPTGPPSPCSSSKNQMTSEPQLQAVQSRRQSQGKQDQNRMTFLKRLRDRMLTEGVDMLSMFVKVFD